MDTLNVIYVIKIFLGTVAAIVCLLLRIKNFVSVIGIGLIIYFGSDRILKQIFIEKVENIFDVTKTGAGIFVAIWIFLWIILFTLFKSL